jgi:hypothetical protein
MPPGASAFIRLSGISTITGPPYPERSAPKARDIMSAARCGWLTSMVALATGRIASADAKFGASPASLLS